MIPAQVHNRPRAQVCRVVDVLDAAPAVVGLVVGAEDDVEPVADTPGVAHDERQLDECRRYRQVVRDANPVAGDEQGAKVTRAQVRAKKPVDRIDVDLGPRQHGDLVCGGQGLQRPRRDAVATTRRLDRGLYEQNPGHVRRAPSQAPGSTAQT